MSEIAMVSAAQKKSMENKVEKIRKHLAMCRAGVVALRGSCIVSDRDWQTFRAIAKFEIAVEEQDVIYKRLKQYAAGMSDTAPSLDQLAELASIDRDLAHNADLFKQASDAIEQAKTIQQADAAQQAEIVKQAHATQQAEAAKLAEMNQLSQPLIAGRGLPVAAAQHYTINIQQASS